MDFLLQKFPAKLCARKRKILMNLNEYLRNLMSLTFLALSSMNAYLKYTNQAHRRVYNIHLYLNVRGFLILNPNVKRIVQNFGCIFDVVIRKIYFSDMLKPLL